MAGGQGVTASQGTLVAYVARPQMTMYQGVVTPSGNNVTVNITGEELTTSQGNLSPGLTLAGQAGTSGAGTLVVGTAKALTGISLTMSQGIIGASQQADDTFATLYTGSLGVEFGITPTGAAAIPAQGTLSASNVQLLGEAAIGWTYNIYPGHTLSLTGIGMTMSQGTLVSVGGTPAGLPAVGTGSGGKRGGRFVGAFDDEQRHDLKLLLEEATPLGVKYEEVVWNEDISLKELNEAIRAIAEQLGDVNLSMERSVLLRRKLKKLKNKRNQRIIFLSIT